MFTVKIVVVVPGELPGRALASVLAGDATREMSRTHGRLILPFAGLSRFLSRSLFIQRGGEEEEGERGRESQRNRFHWTILIGDDCVERRACDPRTK
jgi:hypothetical protein